MRSAHQYFMAAVLWLFAASLPALGQSFVHPGLLQSKADLNRMKEDVAEKKQPVFEGYQVFRQNQESQLSYHMKGPLATVGRNPTVGQGTYDSDANAAYQCAIMWYITGDTAYAYKAEKIINAWASTLTSITGRDAVLMAGLGPFKMINAAEILRYTNAGWSSADIRQATHLFEDVIYPVIKDFAPFANGNWDGAAMKTMMAIGVFCNDRPIFERALRYYVDGAGDGRLSHYIINEEGECQESGRDQQHTQLGLAHLGDCSEIAWHQGLDLFAYEDNLLLKGFEYTARYNLGYDVPFVPELDRTGKYAHQVISSKGRGRLRPIYEQIYNHYVNAAGLKAPFTEQAAAKIRPEGPAKGADHPGFGTLLYSIPAVSVLHAVLAAPAPPAGIVAKGTASQITLSWIGSVNAKSYVIKRAGDVDGPYSVIAKAVDMPGYVDKDVKPGRLYYYTVAAVNKKGESADAYPAAVSAGLPAPWKQEDIGNPALKGFTNFDGRQFTIEGAGKDTSALADKLHFTCMPMKGNGEITARYVPQISSQFSSFGLMMREGPESRSAKVALIITPRASGNIEEPRWGVQLLSRPATGDKEIIGHAGTGLTAPVVSYGRLTGYCWLRLRRHGHTFTGYFSTDGKSWTNVGSVMVALKKRIYAGLAVRSGLQKITTTVKFDQVRVTGWKQDKQR